jgi:hypothetical protein
LLLCAAGATDDVVLLRDALPSVSVDSELFCDDRLPVGDLALPAGELVSPLVMAGGVCTLLASPVRYG